MRRIRDDWNPHGERTALKVDTPASTACTKQLGWLCAASPFNPRGQPQPEDTLIIPTSHHVLPGGLQQIEYFERHFEKSDGIIGMYGMA